MDQEIQNYLDVQNSISDAPRDTTLSVLSDGKSYIKIGRNGYGVHSFICKRDINTKAITAKKGDIMKPASWQAPAKHPRGSVYDVESYTGYRWTGPHYLK